MSWNCKLGQNSEEAKLNIWKNSSHQKTILMQKIPHVDTKTHFLELLTHVLIFASLIKWWLAVVTVYKVGSKIANVGHSLSSPGQARQTGVNGGRRVQWTTSFAISVSYILSAFYPLPVHSYTQGILFQLLRFILLNCDSRYLIILLLCYLRYVWV